VIAQRLVRRLCSECSAEYTPTDEERAALGMTTAESVGRTFREPRGCRACEGSGYRGRVALYERLEMDHTLREMTFQGSSLEDLRDTALATGAIQSLLIDGARKVVDGTTSSSEVLRVTRSKS
jgi:type II secretory ATPase GspE/PulE/Tfp pilus assembly ATPase PilB-like protein